MQGEVVVVVMGVGLETAGKSETLSIDRSVWRAGRVYGCLCVRCV